MTHKELVNRRFVKFVAYHRRYGIEEVWPAGVLPKYNRIRLILAEYHIQASLDEIRDLFAFEGCSV